MPSSGETLALSSFRLMVGALDSGAPDCAAMARVCGKFSGYFWRARNAVKLTGKARMFLRGFLGGFIALWVQQ